MKIFGVKVPKYRRHEKIYARVVSEWLRTGRKTPRRKRLATVRKDRDESVDGRVLTVTELAVRYFEHARTSYVKNGQPTSEATGIQHALRDLRKL